MSTTAVSLAAPAASVCPPATNTVALLAPVPVCTTAMAPAMCTALHACELNTPVAGSKHSRLYEGVAEYKQTFESLTRTPFCADCLRMNSSEGAPQSTAASSAAGSTRLHCRHRW